MTGWVCEVAAVTEPPEIPVRLTYLDLGNTWLQLVEPLDPAHPLAAWLDEHGDGLHHICFGVDDVECELLRLSPHGVPFRRSPAAAAAPRASRAGDPPHGVRIECTAFDPKSDAGSLPGADNQPT